MRTSLIVIIVFKSSRRARKYRMHRNARHHIRESMFMSISKSHGGVGACIRAGLLTWPGDVPRLPQEGSAISGAARPVWESQEPARPRLQQRSRNDPKL